jgi:ABC-2 type transport system permease protein
MSKTFVVFLREFSAYFSTPLAYVFIVIFLGLTGAFTFYMGSFFERGQADLQSFFGFLPWLFLILIPAVSMRLWAEERKSGTIELLMTLPISTAQVVIGKFLAAWAFVCIAIMLTFPIWITVNYLGDPDNGVVAASYIGSLVMAGSYLAIGSCISALTKNQVIAFIVAALVCFLFLTAGLDIVQSFFQGWAPQVLVDGISGLSFLTHIEAIRTGVIDLRDVVFFVSTIAVSLFINVAIIDLKKAA